jgi:outer membrane protein OmpA-like peptidoglycan-associated protein
MLSFLMVSLAAMAQEVPVPQGLNAQNYAPPIDTQATLWTHDANVKPNKYFSARTALTYVKNPLVYRYAGDGEEVALLSDAMALHILPAYNVDRFRFGLDVPIYGMTKGEAENVGGAGLGDVALDIKAGLIQREHDGWGLAVGGRADLPTTTLSPETPIGSDAFVWALEGIVDYKDGPLLVAANLGTRSMPEVDLQNVTMDDYLFWRVGAGIAVNSDETVGLSADLVGGLTYKAGLSNGAGNPVEFMGGAWARVQDRLVMRVGGGTGLSEGIGAPDFRVVAMMGYEPPVKRDKDDDGVINKLDKCRDVPEDKDGFNDADGCPDPSTKVRVIVQDPKGNVLKDAAVVLKGPDGEKAGQGEFEVEVHPGAWQVTGTLKRYATVDRTDTIAEGGAQTVQVVMEPLFGTTKVIVVDAAGNKLKGVFSSDGANATRFKEGIGSIDLDPGAHNIVVRSDGYKSAFKGIETKKGELTEVTFVLEPAKAVITKEKIEIREKVFFDTGKATIQASSNQLLDDVADILKENADIKKIRVEGHTDKVGNAASNRKLSDERAKAVVAYLAAKGVAANRMEAIGYGPDKPVDPASTPEAYEKNRRVEFFIVERDAPAPDAPQ